MRRTVFATVALAVVLPLAAQAQEWPPQPAKFTNVAWYEMWNIDFTGPDAIAAQEALMDVFVPALADSGSQIRVFQHSTGEWDVTMIIPMESPGDLEWEMQPWRAKALVAAAEAVGMERFGELSTMLVGAINRLEVTILRERKGGM